MLVFVGCMAQKNQCTKQYRFVILFMTLQNSTTFLNASQPNFLIKATAFLGLKSNTLTSLHQI